jgi:hypothetical protein
MLQLYEFYKVFNMKSHVTNYESSYDCRRVTPIGKLAVRCTCAEYEQRGHGTLRMAKTRSRKALLLRVCLSSLIHAVLVMGVE